MHFVKWPSDHTVSELLDLLYESAATSGVWEEFLERLAQVMEATHAALLLHDFKNRQYSIAFQSGFSREAQELYSERVGDNDILVRRAISNYPAGWIGIGQSLIRDEELVKAHSYNEFTRFYDIFHQCGSMFTYDGSACQCLTVRRPKRAGRFSKTHVSLVSSLIPHIKRALRLHYQLTDLRAAAETVRSAIDAVSTAIILFDSAGRVLHANPSAQRILASGDGLIIKNGRILAQSNRESLTVQHLINTDLAPNCQSTENEIGTAVVHRREGLPLEVLVTPLKSDRVLSGKHTAAAMFVVDPDQRVRPATELLEQLFSLTPAEARVAALLSDGTPVGEISETLGVSRNTLKTQISCVYGKIGINRQSQLVRLLMQLPVCDKR